MKQSKNIELIAIIGNENLFGTKISITESLRKFQSNKKCESSYFRILQFQS